MDQKIDRMKELVDKLNEASRGKRRNNVQHRV